MFNNSRRMILIIALLIFGFTGNALAQESQPGASFFTSEIITVYFLMLLFATIINRLLEYFKLLVVIVDQRIGLLHRLGNSIFRAIRLKMDRLGIYYDADKVRINLRKYLLYAFMQFWAFVLGILLSWLLKIDVLMQLQMTLKEPYGFIFTGLIIGAGVEPVHSFFRIAQEKRKLKQLINRVKQTATD